MFGFLYFSFHFHLFCWCCFNYNVKCSFMLKWTFKINICLLYVQKNILFVAMMLVVVVVAIVVVLFLLHLFFIRELLLYNASVNVSMHKLLEKWESILLHLFRLLFSYFFLFHHIIDLCSTVMLKRMAFNLIAMQCHIYVCSTHTNARA